MHMLTVVENLKNVTPGIIDRNLGITAVTTPATGSVVVIAQTGYGKMLVD